MSSALLRIAWRSVRKNWRHSVGAGLAVAVGFTAVALFDGYMVDTVRTLTGMMEEQFMLGTLAIQRTGLTEALAHWDADSVPLRESEQAFIDEYLRVHAEEVLVRSRSLFIGGVASSGRASVPFAGWGYDPVDGAALRRRFAWDARYGKPLQEVDGSSVVLGGGLAALLDCAPATRESPFAPDGSLVARERPFECPRPRIELILSTASGQVNAVAPVVAGITDAGRRELDAQFVALPIALAQKLRNTRDVSQYSVLLRDPSAADRFAADLMAAARARGLPIEALRWQKTYHGRQFEQGLGVIQTFRSLMALVVVALVGMAISSTMVKTVNERTREIGTLRSLGFPRSKVTALFALEAALLSGGACLAGLLLTLVTSALINGAGIAYDNGIVTTPLPLGVAIDPATYARVAAFLVGVAVFAAWLPARRAARSRIPDALAYA